MQYFRPLGRAILPTLRHRVAVHKPGAGEVDERERNTLISRQSSRRRPDDAGPGATGRVSCYRLRSPSPTRHRKRGKVGEGDGFETRPCARAASAPSLVLRQRGVREWAAKRSRPWPELPVSIYQPTSG